MITEVKMHNGTPTLFIDGQPKFDGMSWGPAPEPDCFILKECKRLYGEAGVHTYAFDCGTVFPAPEWAGPRKGETSHYDFSLVEKKFKQVIDADKESLLHLRIQIEMPEWWQKLYPDEVEIGSDGKKKTQSWASRIWRQQSKDFLKAFIKHIKDIGMSDRIIAYQVCAGSCAEWVKGQVSMGSVCGDYSRPMCECFQNWLCRRYQGDVAVLRESWAMPYVTFESAEVPSAEKQLSTTHFTFRNPRKEQCVIDYFKCLAELSSNLVIDFCTTMKEASGGKTMVGSFYGYLMELAWNNSFFGDGTDSEYASYQRSGHLGLWKLLQSPNVDFIVSPYSYGFRGIGGDGPCMPPAESLRVHGKLYIYEDDTRTHLTWHDYPNYGKTDVLDDSIAVLKRNFSFILLHGQGIWWLGGSAPFQPSIELSQQPAFRPLIKRFNEIGNWALQLDRKPCAEIAVLLDDESFYYETGKNDLDLPLIFQQRLWGLPKVGAPFDTYLLQDFIEGNIPAYKLYIFLNPIYLDNNRRNELKKQIRNDGRVALWIYAPGYIENEPSLSNMTDLTGFGFGKGDHPWGPMMYITNFKHPITKDLRADLFWGTNNRLGPVFHLDDMGGEILGNVVYSQGRCRPGFAVKEYPEWKSIYVAASNIPAQVLRGIASYSGVHIYSDAGDTFYAIKNLLAVHTAGGGARVISLPEKVEVVYDLFDKKIIATDTKEIKLDLLPASTILCYTGKVDLVKDL